MPDRVQLKEPGSELTMTVSKVSHESVDNIEYWLFADGQKELLVPKTSVFSQLDRLGVDAVINVPGKTIKFSRSTKLSKYGKSFWNLDLAEPGSGAEAVTAAGVQAPHQASAAAQGAAPSAESRPEKPKLTQLYLDATEFVVGRVVPVLMKADIGVSDTAVAAMIATVFISATKER